jgi:hypothetical protein
MHVPSLATDKSFIGFNFSRELRKRVIVHSFADAVKHEPCGLLSYTEGASYFAGTNAVLAIAEHPESAHPLIQTKRGILKNSSHFERELLLTSRAKPETPSFNKRVFLRAAAWASNYTVRPAKIERVLKAAVWIAEVDNRVLKCLRRFHTSNVGLFSLCVKYVIAQF